MSYHRHQTLKVRIKKKINFTFPQVPPKIAHFDFGTDPINFEDSVSATCLISSGDFPIDIEWLFNGYPINAFSGASVYRNGKRNSMLTIDSANAQHAGNYSCVAKNNAASVTYSAELVVNGQIFRTKLLLHFSYIFFLGFKDNLMVGYLPPIFLI